ncbi:MAG: hypothetical protein EBY39_13220 [Flavobacteriia bacterium]|nr:hypothetical protein [Flavobacteriia bacterium]
MKGKLIGLCGLARCGKDSFFEVSKHILNEKGIEVQRYAFADSLKQECDELLNKYVGISAFTEKSSEKEIIRPLLVTYGTHIRRKLNQNCWIDKINNDVTKSISSDKIVFVTDVRFENEIDWIHNLQGESIHITREGNLAPNEEELRNDPILKSKSTQNIYWKNFNSIKSKDISNIVNNILSSIL